MRGRIFYNTEDAEAGAEVESEPLPPMPEAHFQAICGIIKLAIVGAVAVGIVFLAGTGGLFFNGGIAFLYGIYRLIKDNC